MSDTAFELEDFKQAEQYNALGPAYFAARRIADQIMQGSDAEPLRKAVDVAVESLREKLYDVVEAHLLSDLECNVQGHIERISTSTVEALLIGEQWALDRFPLSKRYDGDLVRAAIVQHAGAALRDAYVSDLEKKIEALTADVVRLREWIR